MRVIIETEVRSTELQIGDVVVFDEGDGVYLACQLTDVEDGEYRLLDLRGRTNATGYHRTLASLERSLEGHDCTVYSHEDYVLTLTRGEGK